MTTFNPISRGKRSSASAKSIQGRRIASLDPRHKQMGKSATKTLDLGNDKTGCSPDKSTGTARAPVLENDQLAQGNWHNGSSVLQ